MTLSLHSSMTCTGSCDFDRQSQTRTVVSTDPLTATDDSSFSLTQLTAATWPRHFLDTLPELTSHSTTV